MNPMTLCRMGTLARPLLRRPAAGMIAALLSILALSAPNTSLADDESPTKDDPPKAASSPDKDEKKDEPGKEAKPTAEPSLLDKLSKELFKELDDDPAAAGKPKPEAKEDKFDRVAKGMRSASDKLDGRQTGNETTKIQEQVIKDLDDLIRQLQNPPPNGGGGGGGGSSSNSGGGSSSSSQGSGSSQQRRANQGGKGQSPGGASRQQPQGDTQEQGGQDRKNAQGSDERTDAERKAAAEAARKQKLEMDVWGHLPPHLRDQLLNTYGERMLPKYEQLVKQFYEALSEQSESKPRR